VRSLVLLGAAAVWAASPAALEPYNEAVHQRVVASAKGKVVLIDFWATWCAPCRAEMPALVKLEAQLRARGFRLITVSSDEPEQETDALRFLQKNGVPGPMYLKKVDDDDKFIRSVDAKWSGALPALFLYDRNGRKVQNFIGETDIKVIEAAISKLL